MSALARALIDSGRISAGEMARCQSRCAQKNTSLPFELIQGGFMGSDEVANFIAQTFGFSRCDAFQLQTTQPIHGLSPTLYQDPRYLPVAQNGQQLLLAMVDPTDDALINLARFQSGLGIEPMVADCQLLAATVERLKSLPSAGATSAAAKPTPTVDTASVDDAPAVKFLQQILSEAVERDASDVHFEPFEANYRIRFRIDGLLQAVETPPPEIRDMLASRLKVLSRLNIAEKRLPQDGQMRIDTDQGKPVDFRISTMPTLYGEKIVLRILDRQNARLSIDQLGMSDAQRAHLLQAIRQPSGMILVTGPTGSGKTVSLYACLNELNQPGVNISTAEDPVEIPVTGINQVNIDERTGLTFAVALRAFMRQDPDILMIGEIRDFETADTAVKAAQTGHLLLSTLHTRSAPASLERLRQLGLPAFNVAGSVLLIVAQRLVRRLCDCKANENAIENAALRAAGFSDDALQEYSNNQWQLYRPVGCKKCGHTGYKGRLGLFEVLPVSQAMQRIILANGSTLDMATQARLEGLMDLRQAGLAKVMAGDTSLDEVLAATDPW
ncbi:MAG: type 4 fimbrial assembly protein PilB [Pseudomonadota bacterium]|jgi:type IV pilus assembly protein PilB